MCLSSLSETKIMNLISRLLYLNMFIVLILSFNQFHKPFVFGFVGAIVIMAFMGIILAQTKNELNLNRKTKKTK